MKNIVKTLKIKKKSFFARLGTLSRVRVGERYLKPAAVLTLAQDRYGSYTPFRIGVVPSPARDRCGHCIATAGHDRCGSYTRSH